MTDSGDWRPVPPELDLPGSVYESRVSVTGAGQHPDTHVSWEILTAQLQTGYSYFADVSQFQGVPVNATYGHPIFSFRVCDGNYFDPLAIANWNASKALLADPAHPLSLVWVYFVFRPGTWDSIAASIHRVFGSDKMPPNVAAMIDCEPWGGQVSGNHSAELNQWANNLAGRTHTGQASVVGYSYSSGFAELWPNMAAWIKRHTASYGTWDPSPYGWQYSGGTGTGGLPGWPHGAGPWPLCDMNVIKKPIASILADFGFTGDEDMTPEDIAKIAKAVHEFPYKNAETGVTQSFATRQWQWGDQVSGSEPTSVWSRLSRIEKALGLQADDEKVILTQIAALPTAAQNADAVVAALPPAGPGGPAPDYESEPITITLTPKGAP